MNPVHVIANHVAALGDENRLLRAQRTVAEDLLMESAKRYGALVDRIRGAEALTHALLGSPREDA